jgi:hypothetical protein
MWTNIWEILKSLVSINDRLLRLEKQSEKQDEKQTDLTVKFLALAASLERIAEREKWREENYRQMIEIERMKAENERLRIELERERQQRQLPPPDVQKKAAT